MRKRNKWIMRMGVTLLVCLVFSAFGYTPPGLIKTTNHNGNQKKAVSTGAHTFVFHPYQIANPNEPGSKIYLTWTATCHVNNQKISGNIKYDPRWIDTSKCVNFHLPTGTDYPEMNQVCESDYMATDWCSMGYWDFDVLYKPAKALNEDVTDTGYRATDYIYVSFLRGRLNLVDNYNEHRIYVYRAEYDRNNLTSPLGTWERVPEADLTTQDPDLLDQEGFDVDLNRQAGPFNYLIEPYYNIQTGPGWLLVNQGLCGHDIGRAKVFLTWYEKTDSDPPVETRRNRCYEVNTGTHTALQLGAPYTLPDNTIFIDAAYTEKYLKVSGTYHKCCITTILYANGYTGTSALRLRVISNHYTGTLSNNEFTWQFYEGFNNDFNIGYSINIGDRASCRIASCEYDNDNITISPKLNKWYLLYKESGYTKASVITLTRQSNGNVTGLSTTTPITISGGTTGDVAYVQQGAAFCVGNRMVYLHNSNCAQNILGNDKNPWDGTYPTGILLEKGTYSPNDSRLAPLPLVVPYLDPDYNAAWFNNHIPESVFLAFSNNGYSNIYGKVSDDLPFKDIKFSSSADTPPKGTQSPYAYQLGSEEDDCSNFHTLSFSGYMTAQLQDNNCVGAEDYRKIAFIQYNKPSLSSEDQVYSTKLRYYYDTNQSVGPGVLDGMKLAWRTNYTPNTPESGATFISKCSGTSGQMTHGYNNIEVGQGSTALNFFSDTPIMNNGWYFWKVDSQGVFNQYEKDVFKIETGTPLFRFNYINWEPAWTHTVPSIPLPGYSCALPFEVLCDEVLDKDDIPGVTTDHVDCISGPAIIGHWLQITIPDCYSVTFEMANLQGSAGGMALYHSCAKYPEDPIETKCGYTLSLTYKNETGTAQTIYALVNYHQCEDPVITVSCDDMGVSNDECCGATTLTSPENPVTFNLSGTTKSANTSQCPNYPPDPRDVWFRIPEESEVWVIYMETSSASNSGFIVFTGDCDSLVPVDCSEILSGTEQYIEFPEPLDDELYIKVYGTSSHTGEISYFR